MSDSHAEGSAAAAGGGTAPRWWEMQSILSLPISDALIAIAFVFSAIAAMNPAVTRLLPASADRWEDWLGNLMMFEAAFLLISGTLIDVATRIRRRPPLLVIIVVAAIVVFSSDWLRAMLLDAWSAGLVVFIPFMISVLDRVAVLWFMPGTPPLQRMAARALTANRMVVGIGLLALFAAILVASMMSTAASGLLETWSAALLPAIGAVYFGVAAIDAIRVGSRSFAAEPGVMFRIDLLGVRKLEP